MGEAPGVRPSHEKESTQVNVSEIPESRLSGPAASLILRPRQLRASLPPPSVAAESGFPLAVRREQHQSAFLAVLPHDLHYLLATTYVDFDTLLALRQTCRKLHGILTPDLVRRIRSSIVEQSLENETLQYRNYRSIYPRQRLGHLWDLLYAAFDFRLIERPAKELRCYGCLEIKPLWCFVERMSNRGTGLGAKSAEDRMCKDCMRRYRDIEGEWWKENWVRKSDTVRKTSRGCRFRRWAFEGQSLVNPMEEIGVCAWCGSGTFELWWGCVGCFELQEKRCRQEDLEIYDGFERKVANVVEAWRFRQEAKHRLRQATRDRRTRKWWTPNLSITWGGSLAERKAALVEWKESKTRTRNPTSGLGSSATRSGLSASSPASSSRDAPWRALDQIPLPKSRREARCSSCWVPNCPSRMYILGLAYERPMTRDQWCSCCQQDYERRHARRDARKQQQQQQQMTMGRNGTLDGHYSGGIRGSTGIFDDEWDDNGLGCLFDDDNDAN